jgi:hypothetical protein
MGKHLFFALLFYLVLNNSISAIPDKQDSTLTWLSGKRIFPVIFLDPLECQTGGGSYFLSQEEKNLSLYSTVNLGFTKPIISHTGKSVSWELNFGTAIFTQFDLIKREDGSYLAGLINNDYKISLDYSLKKNKNIFKLRIFHLSSHLGDDYIARNPDSTVNDKSENYEQIDLTLLRFFGTNYLYAGVGEIYTPYVFRERFSMQAGGLLNFGSSKPVSFFTSANIKLLAENDFIPDVRTALGINFNRKSESIFRIWLEYYNGQLPYSTIDYGRVNWLGMALAINLK